MAAFAEPPCTDPYARWCGRGRWVTAAPIPIKSVIRKLERRSLLGQRHFSDNAVSRKSALDLRSAFRYRSVLGLIRKRLWFVAKGTAGVSGGCAERYSFTFRQ